jgi:hypothetical protein
VSLLSSGEPWLLLSDDSVENGEELSGDGDDCDQLWFSGVEEALMEAPERGVVAGGDQSAHEEGGAHLRPAAADEAFAFPLSGLTRPGREPDEACDFAPVEPAEFGQFGDQGAGDGRPDAGHGGEQVLFLPPGRRAAHRFVDVGLEAGELLLQRGEQTGDWYSKLDRCRPPLRWASSAAPPAKFHQAPNPCPGLARCVSNPG